MESYLSNVVNRKTLNLWDFLRNSFLPIAFLKVKVTYNLELGIFHLKIV